MTKIEWTEVTWNPIVGCSLASPGCTNCYAMRFAGTRLAHLLKYEGLTQNLKTGPVWTGKLAFDEKALLAPLGWKRPRMVFVNSMGDLFHESVPDEWIDRVFAVMALCPQHTFQVLTKRARRMREYCRAMAAGDRSVIMAGKGLAEPGVLAERMSQLAKANPACSHTGPLPNVWLGVSVEDQQRADERIPDLLATPAAIRWISAEPLLGPVDLLAYFDPTGACCGGEPEYRCKNCPSDAPWRYSIPSGDGQWAFDPTIDWVVVGGESGRGARPMHPDWARYLRDQCAAAGVPFFFKQWGDWLPGFDEVPPFARGWRVIENEGFASVGKKRAGRLLDGAIHDEMPRVPHA